MRSHPVWLVLVATALASAACGDAVPTLVVSDASSRAAAAPAPDAAARDAAAGDAAARDAAAEDAAPEDAVADAGTSSTADADAGASDVGTSSTADAGPRVIGPSCALLATCCAELPESVFGPSCDTAAMGDEAACQQIVERALRIDRCRRPPPADAGR